MRFSTVGEQDFDYYDPEGRRVDGYVTERLAEEGMFGNSVHNLAGKLARPQIESAMIPNLLMTTERCWSGYSEYTITNQWSQIVLTIPDWNWEQTWPSVAEFLRDVADANPEAGR